MTLRNGAFSLIIDETTDISITRDLVLVCWFHTKEEKRVLVQFYDMISLTSSTAESLFQAVVSLFESDEIPLGKMIGVAADTTNVMFGEHNSVVSRLKDVNPHIYFMWCICHSAHLRASHACVKLPITSEELLRNIYKLLFLQCGAAIGVCCCTPIYQCRAS